jgi:hypothetical protein
MNGWRSMFWVLIPQHRIDDVVHIQNEEPVGPSNQRARFVGMK